MKMFISRELIHQVPDHEVVQHAAADMPQIRLANSEDIQSKGKIMLEAKIERHQVTFEAQILNIA